MMYIIHTGKIVIMVCLKAHHFNKLHTVEPTVASTFHKWTLLVNDQFSKYWKFACLITIFDLNLLYNISDQLSKVTVTTFRAKSLKFSQKFSFLFNLP